MSLLSPQVAAIVETCKTLVAMGKDRPPVDPTTLQAAKAILQQAKEELSNDKVLAAIVYENTVTWAGILTTMQIVQRSLPPTTQEPYLNDE